MLERDVEKWLGERVKELGGLYYKFVSPGNDGVPDRIVILPEGRIYFVELKTKNGRLSPIQEYQIRCLKMRGIDVVVIKGIDEARRWLSGIQATQLSDKSD